MRTSRQQNSLAPIMAQRSLWSFISADLAQLLAPTSGFASRLIGRVAMKWAPTGTPKQSTCASAVHFTLLIATVWLSTRPYLGVIHDSRFYTIQALSALLPGRFDSDLYFQYGSADQFTLFTLAYTVMVVVPLVLLPAIGIGNSPPARKLAVSPESAVRLGSARMVMS